MYMSPHLPTWDPGVKMMAVLVRRRYGTAVLHSGIYYNILCITI